MGNSLGRIFRISTWGESHGGSVGVVIDGCPPGLPLSAEEIQLELDRRRPGQSRIVTPRQEPDRVSILSGVDGGYTLGTPIGLNVVNQDARPEAYQEMRTTFRPSHADFTYTRKFGRRMVEGGGRASARETIGRVAAGAVARKALLLGGGIEIAAWVESIHTLRMPELDHFPARSEIEASPVRCPDPATAAAMIARIESVRAEGDSIGGVIAGRVRGMPAGLGWPVFDRLEADLAKALLSLPATKGFEIGSGFSGTSLRGSEHNDAFVPLEGAIRTRTNRSGGVQGGISNGEDLQFRVAFKPTATIMREQDTVDESGQPVRLRGRGRHDACVLPRAVPIVEAMTALVLIDHWMLQHGQNRSFPFSL